MKALRQTASALERKDDQPNIELARLLAATGDTEGIADIIGGLQGAAAMAGDCIKVLYEIGYRKPELIAPYADMFLDLLEGKNNRLIWGAMIALGSIAELTPKPVYARLNTVLDAYAHGSVITVDNAVSVLAGLCKADASYQARIMPVLIRHLEKCRPKEIPQHFERTAVCLHPGNQTPAIAVVQARMWELTPPQQGRVRKVLKKLGV